MTPSVMMLRSRQEAPKKNTDCCEMIGNPTHLPVLSKVAVVLLFVSLSYALDRKISCTHKILQVHLSKTLVGSRFQLHFQSAAPVTGTIHMPTAVLGLLLFIQ